MSAAENSGAAPTQAADQPPFEWRWIEALLPVQHEALAYERAIQARFDGCVLKLIRSGDAAAADTLYRTSLGFATAQSSLQPRVFWQICAAYFQALSLGLCPVDTQAKRALSGILQQYRSLAGGDDAVAERLLRELLAAVRQVGPVDATQAPVLAALQAAYEGAAAQECVSVSAELEDQVKVVGNLRIGISEFNAYLNESDEWSRRLFVELSEWALELHRPVAESTLELAHSLAAASAAVGLVDLSGMADALEQALRHVQAHMPRQPQQAQVFLDAAEDIRRLLHQFAAGFLKQPEPRLLDALKDILRLQFPALDQTAEAVPDADLLRQFVRLASPLLVQLGGALRQWKARPDNVGARNEAVRVLRNLQHSAELDGATRFCAISQQMLAAIDRFGTQPVQSVQLQPLLGDLDALNAVLDYLQSADN